MQVKTFRVLRSHSVDLEFASVKLFAGKTYHDAGDTVLDSYVVDGLKEGWIEPAQRTANTIVITAKDYLR